MGRSWNGGVDGRVYGEKLELGCGWTCAHVRKGVCVTLWAWARVNKYLFVDGRV